MMNIAFHDYIDWKIKNPKRLDKRLKRNIQNNKKGIILLYDRLYHVSHALPKVIEYPLKRKAAFLRLVRAENKFKAWR